MYVWPRTISENLAVPSELSSTIKASQHLSRLNSLTWIVRKVLVSTGVLYLSVQLAEFGYIQGKLGLIICPDLLPSSVS